jgi:hypothetical protein
MLHFDIAIENLSFYIIETMPCPLIVTGKKLDAKIC